MKGWQVEGDESSDEELVDPTSGIQTKAQQEKSAFDSDQDLEDEQAALEL